MNIIPPPPPLISAAAAATTFPQTTSYNNNNNNNDPIIPSTTTTSTSNDVVLQHSSPSPPPSSSIVIVMIVISSAIILTASLYFLIRFLSRRYNHNHNDVVSRRHNDNDSTDHVPHHVIPIDHNNNAVISLPLFTFSSLTGKIAAGDCAVCLSKFESSDQLRLLPLCCHAFHAPCIDAWLKSNQTCPLCRSSVNPNDEDVLKRLGSGVASSGGGSFRVEIGNVSRRREPSESHRRSYSVGSFEYAIDNDGYEIAVESTHRREVSEDKEDFTAVTERNLAAEVGSGRRNWLRDYVDRVSVSISSRTASFRGGSGRFFGGSSRRSENVDEFEVNNNGSSRIGEEISELFRWFSGV
uniref:E3 ubiquitin-protein ligase ATL4-like n=1 Tax=Erigeron canadensis TaxID=72917 RepID=UPI001CB9511E|nr:E3 ubiquitin-protein ligase ATL4-like [Erigeron canadensis]